MSVDASLDKNENAAAGAVPNVPQGNYRQRTLIEMSKPPEPEKAGETKRERRKREARLAVQTMRERAEQDHALVQEARDGFEIVETEARRRGVVAFPFREETLGTILGYVEQAIPLADYSEFPGAPERPGACTLAGIPYWAFARWREGKSPWSTVEEGEKIRAGLARARINAADTLADRHLHLARVALEAPHTSDAVRVAADILRWQASIRNRDAYGDQKQQVQQAQQVLIQIGTEAPVRAARVLDVTETSQAPAQLPERTG